MEIVEPNQFDKYIFNKNQTYEILNSKIQRFYRILNRKKKIKITKNNEDKINNDIIIKSKIELSDVTRK